MPESHFKYFMAAVAADQLSWRRRRRQRRVVVIVLRSKSSTYLPH